MTLFELKLLVDELIRKHGENKEVMFSYDSGDYWHNMVADPVKDVSIAQVSWSNYHDKFKTLDDEGEEKDTKEVVLLS